MAKKKRAKKQPKKKKEPMTQRRLADELEAVRLDLWNIHQRLNGLVTQMHTEGIETLGPIKEQDDDIPF